MKKLIILSTIFIFSFSLSTVQCQTWNTLGKKLNSYVFAIRNIDSLLYVGGGFTFAGSMYVNNIATWDGAEWDSLGSGVLEYNGINDICKYNNEIFIGGSNGFAKFNGTTWSNVNTGITFYATSFVKALEIYKNKLYFGGGFFKSATPYYNNGISSIASWNDTNCSGLNGGVTGNSEVVNALAVYNNELIAGGDFASAGGVYAFEIAAWNGNNWHALDTGVNYMVNALTVDTINDFLYVSGGFTSAGGYNGVNAIYVARWDGYNWDSLGHYNLLFGEIYALTMYHKKLFAGMYVGGTTINPLFLVKWDGKQWIPVYGPNCTIKALGVYNDELYVGGCFTMINSDSILGIARYYEPPDTTCDYLQAIIEPRNLILKTSDSTTVHFYNNIIHASSWHWNFGDGATDTIRMPVHTYSSPGIYSVSVIVNYQSCTDTAYTTVTIIDDTKIKEYRNTFNVIVYPNPASDEIEISSQQSAASNIEIYNLLGEEVFTTTNYKPQTTNEIDVSSFPAGMYIVEVKTDKIVTVKKFIKE